MSRTSSASEVRGTIGYFWSVGLLYLSCTALITWCCVFLFVQPSFWFYLQHVISLAMVWRLMKINYYNLNHISLYFQFALLFFSAYPCDCGVDRLPVDGRLRQEQQKNEIFSPSSVRSLWNNMSAALLPVSCSSV
jgi:hypothetical protein